MNLENFVQSLYVKEKMEAHSKHEPKRTLHVHVQLEHKASYKAPVNPCLCKPMRMATGESR